MYEDEKTQQNLYAFKPQLEKMNKKGVALIVFLLLVIGFGIYALSILYFLSGSVTPVLSSPESSIC
jgi:hypothetical protein